MSEAVFVECFGFDYSELRDRLSDYLPIAVKTPVVIDIEAVPQRGKYELRDAKVLEIARLRGEWERLVVGHMRRKNSEFVLSYLERERNTLRWARDKGGAKDPGLLAQVGLCELDAGNEEEAERHLAEAFAAGEKRPLACFELARLRFGVLTQGRPAGLSFTAEEVERVVGPLRRAATQTPLLAEVYGLFADAWLRTGQLPPRQDIDLLIKGSRHFVLNTAVSLRIAVALARFGRAVEARALIDRAEPHVGDKMLREYYASLRVSLEKAEANKGR